MAKTHTVNARWWKWMSKSEDLPITIDITAVLCHYPVGLIQGVKSGFGGDQTFHWKMIYNSVSSNRLKYRGQGNPHQMVSA